MTSLQDLKALDEKVPAPFDFEQFEHRRAVRRHRSRTTGWSAAAALGIAAIVPVLAVLTQPEPAVHVMAPAADLKPVAEVFRQPPALVDMGRFLLTSEIEDHIALLDAEISVARLRPVSGERLRDLEATRTQLRDSLESVTQAHALLDL